MNLTILSNYSDNEMLFLLYLIVINIISFSVMGIDKVKAKNKKFRISENMLMILSLIVGASGTLLGMIVFKHKTSKSKFYTGVPILYILNQIIIIIVFNYIK